MSLNNVWPVSFFFLVKNMSVKLDNNQLSPLLTVSSRWWKWPAATSPTSCACPAWSRLMRARTNAASSTSATPGLGTTACAPTCRWNGTKLTPHLHTTGGQRSLKNTNQHPSTGTTKRAGSSGRGPPMTPTLTAQRAVHFRASHTHTHTLRSNTLICLPIAFLPRS